jgi:hypothetical protein
MPSNSLSFIDAYGLESANNLFMFNVYGYKQHKGLFCKQHLVSFFVSGFDWDGSPFN